LRFGALGIRGEDLHRSAVPRGAEDDRFSVLSESGVADGTATERDFLKLQRLGLEEVEVLDGKDADRSAAENREEGGNCPAARADLRRLRGFEGAGGGGLGEMIAKALQVAREILGRGVAFLGIFCQAAFDDPTYGCRRPGRRLCQRLRLLA